MGNSHDSGLAKKFRMTQFHGGYLYLKTDKPFYYPGDKVLGKIYIRVEIAMDAKNMELRVKGREKYSYWYDDTEYYTETYTDDEGNT